MRRRVERARQYRPQEQLILVITFVLFIVGMALVFDFINGFHDSANSIATIVGTRVLSPLAAVVWAATFNFAAAFFGSTAVANAISKGYVVQQMVDANVMCAALPLPPDE